MKKATKEVIEFLTEAGRAGGIKARGRSGRKPVIHTAQAEKKRAYNRARYERLKQQQKTKKNKTEK